jgi:Cdc6-like AAA superfamily ATPase
LDLGGKLAGIGANSVDSATEQHVPLRGGPVDLFRQLTMEIVDKHDNWPLILVIDELERLKNKNGLASLIKSFTHLRFVLVGIANNFHELVIDHASVDRQLSDGVVQLPPMTNGELREIFTKGQSILGDSLVFEAVAIDDIVSMANGFPHFVHFIGREAGFTALDRGAKLVTASDVATAVRQIVATKRAARYENDFLSAVRGSGQKEVVLRAFADAVDEEVHTSDVYPLCESAGVTNTSQYVGGLVSDGVLIKTRERYYRFVDELFRTYVRIRSWKFK